MLAGFQVWIVARTLYIIRNMDFNVTHKKKCFSSHFGGKTGLENVKIG